MDGDLVKALSRISLIERDRSTSDSVKCDQIGRIAREALAAHESSAQGVGDGWVWTDAMLEAGTIASMEAEAVCYPDHTAKDWERFGLRHNRVKHIVNAVLAAAPTKGG